MLVNGRINKVLPSKEINRLHSSRIEIEGLGQNPSTGVKKVIFDKDCKSNLNMSNYAHWKLSYDKKYFWIARASLKVLSGLGMG